MGNADAGGLTATRGFVLAAVALAGFLFSLTPLAERLDDGVLDVKWVLLRKFAPKPAADDILIVGVDEGSVRAIDAPPGLWHEPVGRALERIAVAHPRAIGIELQLPERSYDSFRPGLDAPLVRGIVTARASAVVVASLNIDPRTRAARPIHAPVLAALGDQGLGIGLLGRDADGTARRFSLAIPTEDGAYPTLAGRLCRALAARRCSDGLIDFALGEPFRYVPLKDVLATRDPDYLGKLFRDRIVLLGDVRASDRVAVPLNLAGWEAGGRHAAAVVVHAQSLRTALAGAPVEAAKPLGAILVALAALVALIKDWKLAAATALLGGLVLLVLATGALRSGVHVHGAAPFATAVLALAVGRFGRRP
jgi:adenylate cyclase